MNISQKIQPAPVVRSVTVGTTPERAFDIYVTQMGKWWPKGHSIGAAPLAGVVIEPKADGRYYEVGEDGKQCELGRVIVYDPPSRLVLGWHLNADWVYDPDFEVEVEVTFAAVDDGTLVTLEHRNLERFAERAGEVAASIGGEGGWTGLLRLYQEFCDASF